SNAITHRFTAGLTTHSVLVVHDVDNHWQSTFHIAFPEFVKLVHGGKINSLPNRTTSHRGITNIGHHQARFAIHFLVQGSTHGNITRATHDGIVWIHPEWREESVHRTTQSLIETRFAGKNFSQSSVNQK